MKAAQRNYRRWTAISSAILAMVVHASAQPSLSLQEAIRIGLEHAPSMKASTDRVEIQRAQVAQARLRPNPRLYIQSEDLRPWSGSFSFANGTEDYAYLSQTFEIDGKRGKRIAYADSGVRRSEAEHQRETRLLTANIANAYWAVVSTRAAVMEWHHQLTDFDRLVKYQSDRVQVGATAGIDLLRTQVERDRIALSAAQAERDQDMAEIQLTAAIATPSAQKATLTDAIDHPRTIAELPLSEAVEHRPDVTAARETVSEAHADLRLQHAEAVPNLDFLGGYKRDVGANTLYGGLQLDLPFFNRNQGNIAAAAAGTHLADDQLAAVRLAASAEIESAFAAYQREQGLVQHTLPGMNDRATRNAEIISDAYRTGGTDLLRYLDAERVLIDTRLLAIQTWSDYQRAVVSLQLAYGEQP